jgi:hypothetical protein
LFSFLTVQVQLSGRIGSFPISHECRVHHEFCA